MNDDLVFVLDTVPLSAVVVLKGIAILIEPKNIVSSYRPELEGIRALAVIFVIINHFNEHILPGGFLGVDMFFVLSGYVVSASLYGRQISDWRVFISAFYARRIKRILPALIFCVLITGFVGSFFIQYPGESLRAGKYALFGASNIYFFLHSKDYFGEDARHNLFTHTWSLGVEEQFYLLFPALLVLTGLKAKGRLISALLLLSLASFALWLLMTGANPSFSFFMIPARFWELGLGCLTFLSVSTYKSAYLNRASTPISFMALAVILWVVFLPKELLLISNTVICIAVAALIFSMKNGSVVVGIMSNACMVRIGILSYSLYLWHWPVVALSRHTIGISSHTVVLQVLLIILLSIFSFVFIERPFRYGKLIKSRKLIILTGVSAIVFACGLLAAINKAPNTLFSANMPRFDFTRPVFLLKPTFEQCKVNDLLDIEAFPPDCYFSNPSSSGNTLWMLGDSTTWALKGFASAFSKESHFNIAMFADDSAFPSARILLADPAEASRWELVRNFYERTFTYVIKNVKAGDLVLITANTAYLFCNKPELFCLHEDDGAPKWRFSDGRLLSVNQAFQEFLVEMGELNRNLREKGARLIVSAPLPRWEREHRIYCERQWFRPSWENDKCQNPSYSNQLKSRARLIKIIDAAKDKQGFFVYDPFPLLCNEISCDFSDPQTNENFWIDETHLSTSGGLRIAPDFKSFLKSKGLM